MKKILAALFVMLLLAGCIPALAVDDAAYVGTWIYKHDDVDPVDLMIEMIHLAEDHQAFYILQSFYNGKSTLSRRETGTWKTTEDGIEIEIGEKYKTKYYAELELSYAILEVRESWSSEKILFNAASSDLMTKMTDDKLKQFEENGESRQESGVRVPMGEYLIGEYIPAGNYRVTLTGEDLAVVWVYKKGAIMGQYYSLVYKTGETVANIRLSDGDTFKVEHATVILSEMTGL